MSRINKIEKLTKVMPKGTSLYDRILANKGAVISPQMPIYRKISAKNSDSVISQIIYPNGDFRTFVKSPDIEIKRRGKMFKKLGDDIKRTIVSYMPNGEHITDIWDFSTSSGKHAVTVKTSDLSFSRLIFKKLALDSVIGEGVLEKFVISKKGPQNSAEIKIAYL